MGGVSGIGGTGICCTMGGTSGLAGDDGAGLGVRGSGLGALGSGLVVAWPAALGGSCGRPGWAARDPDAASGSDTVAGADG